MPTGNIVLPPEPKTGAAAPPPTAQPASWQDIITATAKKSGVDPRLALAVAAQESNFNPLARGKAGDTGLFQLMPKTAKDLGVDPNDPVQNIQGGITYLKQHLDLYKGDVSLALSAYNAGAGGLARAGRIPNPEYVQGVLGRLKASTAQAAAPAAPVEPPPTYEGRLSPSGSRIAQAAQQATSIGPPPPLWQRVSRFVLPTAGAMAGAASGAELGAPLGPWGVGIGGVIGAAVGGGGGEATQVGVEKLAGGNNTLAGLKSRVTETALASGLGEGAFRGVISPVLKKFAAPFAKSVTPAGREAMDTLTQTEHGASTLGRRISSPVVTPAQVTESRALDIADNIVKKSILGGGPHKEILARQTRLLDDVASDLIEDYGGRVDSEHLGTALQQARVDKVAQSSARATHLYEAVAKKAEGAAVDLTPLEAFTKQEPRARTVLYGMLDDVAPGWREQGEQVLSDGTPITGALKAALQQMGELPAEGAENQLTYSAAQRLRQSLTLAQRKYAEDTTGTKNIQLGVVKQLIKRLDEGLETGLKGAGGPDLVAEWRGANAFVKDYRQAFDDKFMRGLAKADPSSLAHTLLTKAPERIRQVRATVGPGLWQQVQARTVEDLVSGAQGRVSGKSMTAKLFRLGDRAKELFPQGLEDIRRLARDLTQLETTKEGTGGMYIQLAQAGAAATLLGGVAGGSAPERLGGAALILLGPAAIGKLMLSPLGRKWLTTGILQGERIGSTLSITGEAAAQLAALSQRTSPEEIEGKVQPPPRVTQPQISAPPR